MQEREDPAGRTDRESAEDSPENTEGPSSATSRMESGSGQVSHPEKPIPPTGAPGGPGDRSGRHPEAGGVANRSHDTENREPRDLPERGTSKPGSHAS